MTNEIIRIGDALERIALSLEGNTNEIPDTGPTLPASTPEGLVFRSMDDRTDYLEEGPEAITVQEASKILNCSETTIENMRKDGRLRSYYRGRSVRLHRQQVLEARQWWSVAKGKV